MRPTQKNILKFPFWYLGILPEARRHGKVWWLVITHIVRKPKLAHGDAFIQKTAQLASPFYPSKTLQEVPVNALSWHVEQKIHLKKPYLNFSHPKLLFVFSFRHFCYTVIDKLGWNWVPGNGPKYPNLKHLALTFKLSSKHDLPEPKDCF